jgi:flagellar hook-length control protein FliK
MKANLKANSKDAANLLMQNLADIKSQLSDKSIKIDEVNIELYQEDTTFFSNQGFNSQLSEEQQKNSNKNKSSDEEMNVDNSVTEGAQDTIEGNLNYLA